MGFALLNSFRQRVYLSVYPWYCPNTDTAQYSPGCGHSLWPIISSLRSENNHTFPLHTHAMLFSPNTFFSSIFCLLLIYVFLCFSYPSHSQVLWSLVMANAFQDSYVGAIMLYPVFAFWAMLTLSVMGKWRDVGIFFRIFFTT